MIMSFMVTEVYRALLETWNHEKAIEYILSHYGTFGVSCIILEE